MANEQPGHTTRRFTVIFEKEDDGGYHVFCPTLPGCHTQSETVDEGLQHSGGNSTVCRDPCRRCTSWQLMPKQFGRSLRAADHDRSFSCRRDRRSLVGLTIMKDSQRRS